MRNGNVKRVMSLSMNDQQSLWDSLSSGTICYAFHVNSCVELGNFEVFLSVVEKLVPADAALKHVPIKIHLQNGHILQDLVPPTIDEGAFHILD